MRVLVVEDELLIALGLEDILTRAGHEVLGPATTASHALEVAEKDKPDLALVDITLGDGSKGTDLAREMRRRWNTPVIFVSASVKAALENRDVALGYLAKPFEPEDVLGSVEVAQCVLEGGHPPPPPIPEKLQVFT